MAKLARVIAGFKEHGSIWLVRGAMWLVLVFLFFIAGGGISQNDRWRVYSIEVSGMQTVDRDAIEEFIREELKGNYYFIYARENSRIFPRHDVETGLLETFPRISRVSASRVDLHTIAVVIVERKPYALWCGETYSPDTRELANCFFIDNAGFVFDRAPIFSKGVYLEVYGKLDDERGENPLLARVPGPQFALVYTLVNQLAREVGNPIRVIFKQGEEVAITIDKSAIYPVLNGAELRFKENIEAESLMKNLMAALPIQFPDVAQAIPGKSDAASKKKLLYIDMRYGNKIFFGFEN
ncbi:MAG: cell division protein FtsQ/DivIB [Minisyncoccota bacterium]